MKSASGLSIFLFLCIFSCSNISLGQIIPEITVEELPEFTLNRNDCFDGESLWGYMNGGADIYLEYGFETLRVEEFSDEDEIIKLEIFKMTDPISAFGIFSTKTFKCEQSEVITSIDCLNRFQFQILSGKYYIQLINESGSAKAKQAMINLAETLLKKIEHKEIILPTKYLTNELGFSFYDIKMIKGDLGIHNKTMYLEGCFNGLEGYQVYYAKKAENGEKVKYYEIVFDDPEMKIKFRENNNKRDFWIIKESNTSLVIQQL